MNISQERPEQHKLPASVADHQHPPIHEGASIAPIEDAASEREVDELPMVEALRDVRGHVDSFAGMTVRGWAVDVSRPASPVWVEVWEEDNLLVAGETSYERNDVTMAGYCGDRSGFSLTLPEALRDNAPHRLTVRVAGTDVTLGEIDQFVAPAAVELRGQIALRDAALVGWVEASEGADVLLAIELDGVPFRRVSLETPTRGGRVEFGEVLPPSLQDGRVHWFRLFHVNSDRELSQGVGFAPFVATREDTLQRYANNFPSALSSTAAMRFESLQQQLANAPAWLARQGGRAAKSIDLAAWFTQISVALRQVQRGIAGPLHNPSRLRFPTFSTPDVTIVVPVHNKLQVTYNCLASLLLAPNHATFEVVVVDDGSSDATQDLGELVENIRILRNDVAQGFVRSCNRGAEDAAGRYIVMLNNDTEVGPGWLDELLFVFERFPNAGLAGARLLYPDGRLQEAGGMIFQNFDVWNYGRDDNPHDPRYSYTRQAHYISGACIMLPRELWRELGGFSETFAPAYYEDTDLAFRVREAGRAVYYTPFAKVIHFEGVSNGVSLASGMKRYQVINEAKFRTRWARAVRALPANTAPDIVKDYGVQLRALVIDAETPQPDKNAGGYAAEQEMWLLQALGFKVTFVAADFAYFGNYTDALQRQGIECLYAPYHSSFDSVLASRGDEFDVVYITRYSIAERVIDQVRTMAPRARILFNNADLHFLREIRAALIGHSAEAMQAALRTRDAELSVMRRADVTLSYTEVEAAVILSHNMDSTKVARCPWVLEPRGQVPGFADRDGVAFLGGFRHPPNAKAVQFFVAEVMPLLRKRIPGVIFRIFGSHASDELRTLDGPDIVVQGWVEDVNEAYDCCRVFVAPLLSGAGIKGKALGALASGVPSVLSPVAAEGIGARSGSEIAIAETAAEWVDAIVALYGDEARWQKMSAAAQVLARERYSFAEGTELMRKALCTAGIYV
jgi:GT2 family glycosyltransferase